MHFNRQNFTEQIVNMRPKTSPFPTIHVLRNASVNAFTKQIAEEKRAKLLTEPFTVTNISAIIDQIENWRNWFGNIQPYYALKAQNNPVTRRIFHQLGLGYDCASLTEMEDVLSTGCDPRQIVVSHPYKSYHCISGNLILSYPNTTVSTY